MKIEFYIYLATREKWVCLQKEVDLPAVPREGEYVKFNNAEMGDYFPFKVNEVTYRECGKIEVMMDLLDNIDNRMYSFEDESEFNEYLESYLAEGWVVFGGIRPNTRIHQKS